MSSGLPTYILCPGKQQSCSHQCQERIQRQHIAHKFDVEAASNCSIHKHPGENDQPQTSIAPPDTPHKPEQAYKGNQTEHKSHAPQDHVLEDLPKGARVGTSSLRRQAQLKAIRPDLDIHPLRGNVDTRLRKLEQGDYDAVILAAAGLKRLGKTELIKQIIPAEIMCPAAGQGALGIEIREGDAKTRELLSFLNDSNARAATTCERALLNSLGGGCQVPIGAFAEMKNGTLHLESIVADPDGSKLLRDSRDGDDPEKLGNEAGASLLKRGGDAILEAVYGRGLAVPPQP